MLLLLCCYGNWDLLMVGRKLHMQTQKLYLRPKMFWTSTNWQDVSLIIKTCVDATHTHARTHTLYATRDTHSSVIWRSLLANHYFGMEEVLDVCFNCFKCCYSGEIALCCVVDYRTSLTLMAAQIPRLPNVIFTEFSWHLAQHCFCSSPRSSCFVQWK